MKILQYSEGQKLPHVFLTHLKTQCDIYVHNQRKLADSAVANVKCRVASMRHLSKPQWELPVVVISVKLNEQIVKEREMKILCCSVDSDSSTVFKWRRHRKLQFFVANRVAEILDRTDASHQKHVSSIHNPADIGTGEIKMRNSNEKNGSLVEWPEQVILVSPQIKEHNLIGFFRQAQERKALI